MITFTIPFIKIRLMYNSYQNKPNIKGIKKKCFVCYKNKDLKQKKPVLTNKTTFIVQNYILANKKCFSDKVAFVKKKMLMTGSFLRGHTNSDARPDFSFALSRTPQPVQASPAGQLPSAVAEQPSLHSALMKMANVVLEFTASAGDSEPQNRPVLILGQQAALQQVPWSQIKGKLEPVVTKEVTERLQLKANVSNMLTSVSVS